MALEIQQSINQMLSSAGTMAGIYKAIKAPEEAEKRKAQEHAKQQETAKTEAIAAAADTRKLFDLDSDYGEILAIAGEGNIQIHKEELKQRYQLLDKMGKRYEGFIPGYADTMSEVYSRLQMAEGELHSRLKAEQAAKQAEAQRRDIILNPQKYPKEVR